MFEFETSISRPTAYELHRRARREQSLIVNAFISNGVHKFAQWLSKAARNGVRLARAFAAEQRLRRDIRTLQQLEERALRDMGLSRGEIERVVRYGRRLDFGGLAAALRPGHGRAAAWAAMK